MLSRSLSSFTGCATYFCQSWLHFKLALCPKPHTYHLTKPSCFKQPHRAHKHHCKHDSTPSQAPDAQKKNKKEVHITATTYLQSSNNFHPNMWHVSVNSTRMQPRNCSTLSHTALPQVAQFGSSEQIQKPQSGATKAPPCLQATIQLPMPALCFALTGLLCVWQTNLQSSRYQHFFSGSPELESHSQTSGIY